MIRCPSCAEKISSKETECPFCGEEIPEGGPKPTGQKKRKKSSGSNGSIIAIIAVVAVGGMVMCGGVMLALLLPAIQQAREAARRTQCKNNLKQVGLGMFNYESTFTYFPAAHLNDENDRPRISWRVSILQFVDEVPRFNNYNHNVSWDDALNAALVNPLPRVYNCPSNPVQGTTNTSFAAVTGPDTVMGDGVCVRIAEISDGTSNTIMTGEASQANILWMKPRDISELALPPLGDPTGFSSHHRGGMHVLFADGSVRFLSNNVDPNTFKGLITRNQREQIGAAF